MSLLLCHTCYSWVEPRNGRCPDCDQIVDSSEPDPPIHVLKALIGEIVVRIGEIRIPRKRLPDCGMLYGTTNGFYFLPHQSGRVTRLVETETVQSKLFWSLAVMAWTPLIVVLPFVKTKEWKAQQIPVLRPQFLTPAESGRLAELLMRNPGVFFIPRKSIRGVERRRRGWTIERLQGRPLKLKPIGNRQRFHNRMSDLTATERWQHLLIH